MVCNASNITLQPLRGLQSACIVLTCGVLDVPFKPCGPCPPSALLPAVHPRCDACAGAPHLGQCCARLHPRHRVLLPSQRRLHHTCGAADRGGAGSNCTGERAAAAAAATAVVQAETLLQLSCIGGKRASPALRQLMACNPFSVFEFSLACFILSFFPAASLAALSRRWR
jgi:hypothetical protein